MSKRQAELAARFASYQKGSAKAKRSAAEEIEQTLNDMKEKLTQAPTLPPETLQTFFDDLKAQIVAQFEILASTASLSNHDRQKLQANFEEFEKEMQIKSDELVPRKKFSFKSKGSAQSSARKQLTTQVQAVVNDVAALPLAIDDRSKKISGRTGEVILVTEAQGVVISDCASCKIFITAPLSMLRIANVSDSLICCAPISGSVYLEHCKSSKLHLCSRQFRAFKISSCELNLWTMSKPTIDTCDDLAFGPYAFEYESFALHFKEFGGEGKANLYAKVQDFNWLYLMAGDAKSPHWRLLSEEESVRINLIDFEAGATKL